MPSIEQVDVAQRDEATPDVTKPNETGALEDTLAVAAVEEAPAVVAAEEAPAVEEAPAAEEALAVEDTPAVEEAPVVQDEDGVAPPSNAFATNATATPNYNEGAHESVHGGEEAIVAGSHEPIQEAHDGYVDPLDDPQAESRDYTEDDISELEMLRQDNEVLRSVIRRSKDSAALNAQVHANIKLQSAYEAKCRELKKETQLRKQSESSLSETRSKLNHSFQCKAVEAKKYYDLYASLRVDNDLLKEKCREQEALIAILRRENVRLNNLCKDNHVNTQELPPDYTSTIQGNTRPGGIVVTKSLLTMSPTNFRKEVLKVNATTSVLNSASTSSVKRRSVSPANPEALNASASATARSISPGGVSQSSTGFIAPIPHPFLEVGQKVTWKAMQGVVRYIGEVEPLGEGTWVGLELQEGRGEHSGLAFGKRYFSAPARSSVFVLPSDLTAGRKPGYDSANVSSVRARSPQSQSPSRTPDTSMSSPQKKSVSTSPKFKSTTNKPTNAVPPMVTPKKSTPNKKSPAVASTNAVAVDIPTASTSTPNTFADDGKIAALAEEY